MVHPITHTVGNITYFAKGQKSSEQFVINSIALNHEFVVITWDYTGTLWTFGRQINVIHGPNGQFLRTVADKTVRDNLDNLINYTFLI